MDPGLSDVSVRSERSGTAVLQVQGDVQQQVPQQDRAGFLSALPNKKEVVRQFTPSWFTVTMGTGAVALTIGAFPFKFSGRHGIALAVWSLNVGLFILFSCLMLGRAIFFTDTMRHLYRHSNQSLFVGAIPMAFSTITNGVVAFLTPRHGLAASQVAQALFWINLPGVCISVVVIPFSMFTIHDYGPQLSSMTAVWLLPVVPACVAANTAGVVAQKVPEGDIGMSIVSIGLVLLGIGFFLSYQITTIYYNRLTCHKLPAREVIVSSFLPVGPMAMTAMALINLALAADHHLLPYVHSHHPSNPMTDEWLTNTGRVLVIAAALMAMCLWGFAIWWLVVAVSCIADTVRQGIPFNLGWWGSVFPVGVVTLATCLLAEVLDGHTLRYLGAAAVCLHVLLWLVVVALTAKSAWLGQLFHAPCLHAAAPVAAVPPAFNNGDSMSQCEDGGEGSRKGAASRAASQALMDLEDKLQLPGCRDQAAANPNAVAGP